MAFKYTKKRKGAYKLPKRTKPHYPGKPTEDEAPGYREGRRPYGRYPRRWDRPT